MTPVVDPRTPVVVAARRTPVGTAGRALRHLDVTSLAAPVLRALVADLPGAPPVDEVVLGDTTGPGGNIARVAALQAGLGVEVPGLTVDRQCGSGLEAITLAATLVAAGRADLVLAGGAESASTAPWRLARPQAASGLPRPYARAPFAPPGFADPDMGVAAEDVARLRGVSRERQDAFAVRSHARALAARAAGRLRAELVPVGSLEEDERPRAGLTGPRLARLPAAFVAGGTVTAGNSCGISDGAGAVAVVPEAVRARLALPGLRVVDWACVGVDPALPGLGPVPAVRRALAAAGVSLAEVGAVEITEAFAGQVLACLDELGLDPLGTPGDDDRVNADGGAIALGHPWAASGALLVVRLFSRMVRGAGPRWGLATAAVGGGMGVAALVERVG